MPNKKDYENQVINQVKKYGGASIFWITENQCRAWATQRLEDAGKIIRQKDQYPWCAFKIKGK